MLQKNTNREELAAAGIGNPPRLRSQSRAQKIVVELPDGPLL
jgi:hypothetical protein